jgi:hypothetical protein
MKWQPGSHYRRRLAIRRSQLKLIANENQEIDDNKEFVL